MTTPQLLHYGFLALLAVILIGYAQASFRKINPNVWLVASLLPIFCYIVVLTETQQAEWYDVLIVILTVCMMYDARKRDTVEPTVVKRKRK